MKFFYSEKFLEYREQGHPESPERLQAVVDYLKKKGESCFEEVMACPEETLLVAHSVDLLSQVKRGNFFDPDTPAIPGIYNYALLSCAAAVQAMEAALTEKLAFSLARPPGHHATSRRVGGFCYFNNMAVAALQACRKGLRVAVLDLDGHHGNGSEEIIRGRENLVYLSLHQSPAYPGTGLYSFENCHNFPLLPGTGGKKYLQSLEKALEIVSSFNPDLVGVSFGLDTHEKDPLLDLRLTDPDYKRIGGYLAGLNKRIFVVLEGGYHPESMGAAFYCFLKGLTGKKRADEDGEKKK